MPIGERLHWHTVAHLPGGRQLFDDLHRTRRHLLAHLRAPDDRPLRLFEDAQHNLRRAMVQHAYHLGQAERQPSRRS